MKTTTKLSKEDQKILMRWPYVYGIPIFEADSVNKEIHLSGWSTSDFRQKGRYDKGAAARLGPTLKGDLYSVCLDFDGWEAVFAWFESWDRVVALAQKTLIEWHQNKGKIHVLMFTKESIPNKKIHVGKDNVLLEVRCDKQPLFISPSLHRDGNKYSPLGADKIELLDDIGLLKLRAKIDLFQTSTCQMKTEIDTMPG
jgi:hypothetical protein